MKEITKAIYVSEDGKEFLDKTECALHETSINETKKLKAHIKEYCKNTCSTEYDDYFSVNVCVAEQCLFYKENYDCNCVFGNFPYLIFE